MAQRAGVSVSTASRVLNGYEFVSPQARSRVLVAVEELKYRPNVAARSMRTGTSRAIGFVVSDFSNPLFSAIAKGVDEIVHPHGYSLVLANSQNDSEREAEAIALLRQRRVDGLIVAVADERAPSLAERLEGFPATVLLDREVPGARADAVLSDHSSGMAQALAHLAGLGHRRIALIAGSQGQRGSRARVESYRASHVHLGLALDERLARTGELSAETGYLALRELLASDAPPTAVIAGNNQLFVGVLSALRDLGLRIPQDVSLVTCDDIDLSRLHDPPIDVIDRDPLELGRTAAHLVLARLEARDGPPLAETRATVFHSRASSALAATSVEARPAPSIP